jgi:hypothetical protein
MGAAYQSPGLATTAELTHDTKDPIGRGGQCIACAHVRAGVYERGAVHRGRIAGAYIAVRVERKGIGSILY